MPPDPYGYEKRLGEWVTARCRKRAEVHGKPMPVEVKHWLDHGGNSPVTKDTKATETVLGWVVKTLEDPDWIPAPL